jgi:hypothetical protein
VDLTKVVQIAYVSPTPQLVALSIDGPSHPTISITAPPSKSKAIVNTKQEKQKKPTSITLLPQTTQESSTAHPLLTLYPTSKAAAIEWRDALRFLVGLIPGPETEDYTKRLADVGVRVKLLDIVAGGVEIPKMKPVIDGVSESDTAGKVSITGEFWYDSIVD